ncbi:MAG: hypothetical protein PUJ82_00705 [Spirochaetales bacterium]|nr:hypothetical protein [Spirochaetia bacterium]MDD7609429.1 hypothetical protein [Spirochaetales bacterium]MDY5914571.1 hypothetical protein [Treponema sp.]
MMTETNLKEILKTLFSIDDEHLLPITTNWFVPEIKPWTKDDTIGYRILSKSLREENGKKYLKANFRLTFVGKYAEGLSQNVLLWQGNEKVNSLFEKYNIQIDYSGIEIFSYPVKEINEIAWIADLSAKSFLDKEEGV